jgi:hypothetical protein
LSAYLIAVSLFLAPGCGRPADPTPSPLVLTADAGRYLQDFAKIKTDIHERIGARYDKASNLQSLLLSSHDSLAQRKRKAVPVRAEMQAVTDALPAAEQKISALHCPPACRAMSEHYLAYLKAMQQESQGCIAIIDAFLVENPQADSTYQRAAGHLEGLNTSRNLEMAAYVEELKKIAAGLGESTVPTPSSNP